MRAIDRILQRWRIRKALPYIRHGDRLLDVGCYDGALLKAARGRVSESIGLDPLAEPAQWDNMRIMRGTIPGDTPLEDEHFDCITLLAVLEHVIDKEQLSRACFQLLRAGGRVVITVPRPSVDHILKALVALRLIDGMSLEEHHDFDIRQTPQIFEQAGFKLIKRRSFQLGLNCLFVFEKPESTDSRAEDSMNEPASAGGERKGAQRIGAV